MSIEAIKKFLKENAKGNQELSETHIDEYLAAETERIKAEEKRIFQAEASKIRKDIEKLKPFKSALEDVGFDGTSELSEFIEALKKAKESGASGPAKSDLEKKIEMLTKQVSGLTTEYQKEQERANSLLKERRQTLLKEALMKDVGEKLAGGEAHVKTLIYEGKVDFDEDGKTILFKSGDALEAYETGVKKYLEANKADFKDSQKGGAGSAGGAGKPTPVTTDMKPLDMLRLPKTK